MIFIFAFVTVSFAETTIKAEVDKTILTTDDTLTYKIIITSSKRNLLQPDIQKFKGFDVLSSVRSSNISFAKDKIKTFLVYTSILLPTETGKLQIPPASIKVKDKVYLSESFEIEVIQGKNFPLA